MANMRTMNITLPETLQVFVDEQVNTGGFQTTSEYIRELIHKEQSRLNLRELVLAGAASAAGTPADAAYFADLRKRVKQPG